MEQESSTWVLVHRKLQEHWLWNDKPFSKGHAWLDLIIMADHKPKSAMLNGQKKRFSKGTVLTSEDFLGGRWGWSRSKVHRFLKTLENDGMLVKESDNRRTALTLVNYGDYQTPRTANGQRTKTKRTSGEQQRGTNKEHKNKITKEEKTVGCADISPSELKGKNPDDMTEEEKQVLRAWMMEGA